MYPLQQPQRRKKKPHRALLIVLSTVLGVLALCVAGAVIVGLTSNDDNQSAGQPTPNMASMLAEQGIPPEPDAATRAAYVAALRAIDPDIVHDKEEKAIDRGRNQCGSIKESPDDQAKLVGLANLRFTSPNHSDGFGAAKAEQILAVVRQYICPTY